MQRVRPRLGASLAWAGEIPADLTELDPPTSPRFAALLDVTAPDIPVVQEGNSAQPRKDEPAQHEPAERAPRPGEYAPITLELLERLRDALEQLPLDQRCAPGAPVPNDETEVSDGAHTAPLFLDQDVRKIA